MVRNDQLRPPLEGLVHDRLDRVHSEQNPGHRVAPIPANQPDPIPIFLQLGRKTRVHPLTNFTYGQSGISHTLILANFDLPLLIT